MYHLGYIIHDLLPEGKSSGTPLDGFSEDEISRALAEIARTSDIAHDRAKRFAQKVTGKAFDAVPGTEGTMQAATANHAEEGRREEGGVKIISPRAN